MIKAIVKEDGLVEIPVELREMLDIKRGDEINFVVMDDGYVFFVPDKLPMEALANFVPRPSHSLSVEEMQAVIEAEAIKRSMVR